MQCAKVLEMNIATVRIFVDTPVVRVIVVYYSSMVHQKCCPKEFC